MTTRQISLAISGMSCASCAVDLERALGQLDGVVTAHVNYATERASIIYDPERVTVLECIRAIRRLSFDTPLEHHTFYSDDLLSITSARTVEQVIRQVEGVVNVSVAPAARRIDVGSLPSSRNGNALQRSLRGLGLRTEDANSASASLRFAIRVFALIVIWALTMWSVGSHVGWLLSPGSLHAPFVVAILALVLLFAAGLPLFRSSFAVLLKGEFDASVLTVLAATGLAVLSLFLEILVPTTILADLGLETSATLVAGWFVVRAHNLWVSPRLSQAINKRLGSAAVGHRQVWIPVSAGVLAVAAMLGVYLGTLTLVQSSSHAWEQLVADGIWVGLVSVGFGVQIGLYALLRLMYHVARAAGVAAVTGAGTGTSTLGMLACCAHHLNDVAPLIAFTGASGLSGAVGFLTQWKYAFIGSGIAMNAIAIVATIITIRKCLAHRTGPAASASGAQAEMACH